MYTICACGVYEIDQSTATYHKGEKPMCNENTCQKVREHRHLNYDDDGVANDPLVKRLYPDI